MKKQPFLTLPYQFITIQFLQKYFTKIFDKRDDFDFNIVNFPFLEGDVPRCTIILFIYIYLNVFALPEHLRMLMTSIILNTQLIKQSYRYHKH